MPADRPSPNALGGDEWIAVALMVVVVAASGVWCGAQLATLLSTAHFLDASIGDALGAMLRLPNHVSQPSQAWPAEVRGGLPGPFLYWPATIVVSAGQIVGGVWLWLRFGASRIGTQRRRRLGVDVGARLATRKDLAPLIVDGPTPGRFIIGTVGRRLVATESRTAPPAAARRAGRKGDRSAVAVIGPTRSGKTATVTAGILDWDGPAILSSVQNDLFDATVHRRLQLGDVYVFDPMRTIPDPLPEGVQRCGWSPLQSARTISGAMEAANLLLEAAPSEGVTNANYWSRKGEALLWPILFAAAINQRTMADVVRWLALQDGNSPDPAPPAAGKQAKANQELGGEIRGLLRSAMSDPDPRIQAQAQHALAQFDGF